jgi:outer membrane protein insertion porin family
MNKRITYWASAFFLVFVWLVSASTAMAQQAGQESFVEDVEIRGNRRIPRESILYYVQSKPQDRFDQNLAQRDLQSILQIGLFDPLATKLFIEDGPRGGKIIIFQVKEYPIIRQIRYPGLKSATESEVLTMFRERRVQISNESTLDPAKANNARVVLRQLLEEKGHPEAKVNVEIEEISATTVALVFNIEEGPRVRVKEIAFVGDNKMFSQRQLRGAMKLVKESGMLSTFTSKDIYFRDKLDADIEHVRRFLGSKGYLQAKLGEPRVEPAGKTSSGIPIPLLRKSGPGLKIMIPIEVGRRYKISKIDERGVSIFPAGTVTFASALRQGEIVDANKIADYVYGSKGVKALYGKLGYIQADVNFIPKFVDRTPEEGDVEVTLEVDEGRQFSLRRLEFIGNTNTRDVVLRREVMIDEGAPYDKSLWDYSILRLNQLGLFDEIKEKDAITRTNDRDQTVDIDLQVKEKGRQQIQLNGGVSGYAGSFFGIEYQTNNFLGYGETLSLAFSGGNRQVFASFGFTEPYFLGKPISLGFQLFAQQYQFVSSFDFSNQLQAAFGGLQSVNTATLFTQKTVGGSISLSSPLSYFTKSKFAGFSRWARLGLSYELSTNKVQDPDVNRDNDLTNDVPSFLQPPVLTSRITPSLYYNTKNAYLDPTNGQSIYLGFGLAGLGGDVRTFSPRFEYQRFMPILRRRSEKPHVLAMRFQAAHIRTFGKLFDSPTLSFVGGIPIYERFYLGGENDIRGYNFRSVSPMVQYNSYASTQNARAFILTPDGTTFVPAQPNQVDQSVTRAYTFQAPFDPLGGNCGVTPTPDCNIRQIGASLYPIGGDTQFIYNLEYRIPIVSVLSLAAFADVGSVFNSRTYADQVVRTGFFPEQDITSYGANIRPPVGFNNNGDVLINDQTRALANQDVVNSAPNKDQFGTPDGYTPLRILGQPRNYSIVDMDQAQQNFFTSLRSSLVSSMGLEFRVQMPVINVPFRLIWAYNPQARTDPFDPVNQLYGIIERKSVFRFSVGRTF